MNYWLGIVSRQLRDEHGLTMMDIANRAGVAESVISRFEMGDGWRRRTDAIVEAYAVEAGVEPDELWQRALDSWRSSRS